MSVDKVYNKSYQEVYGIPNKAMLQFDNIPMASYIVSVHRFHVMSSCTGS